MVGKDAVGGENTTNVGMLYRRMSVQTLQRKPNVRIRVVYGKLIMDHV